MQTETTQMADRYTAQEVVQIGPETTLGTKVAATRLLSSLNLELASAAEFDTIASMGQEFDAGVAMRQEWATGAISGKPTYTELLYVLQNKFGAPVTANLGGSPVAYSHTWTRTGLVWPTPKGWTVERGVVNGGDPVDIFTYALINNLTLGFTRTAEQTIGGSMIARAIDADTYYLSGNATYTLTAGASPPTAGTYTLTVGGQTTAAINWNATPAQVEAAIELLSSVGTGNVNVTLTTLGPTTAVANTVYTIEYIGALGQTAVTQTGTFTGLTASNTITSAAGVAGAALTALDNVPILAGHVDVYNDPTFGALGTTKLLRDFIFDYESGDQLDMFWPLNSALTSFGGHTLNKADSAVTLTIGDDPTGRAFYDSMRTNTSNFMRLQATGPVISGANSYRLRIDLHGKVYGPPAKSDTNGLSTLDIPMRIVRDATWAKALVFELITSVASAA